MDSEGKIKKILINKTLFFAGGMPSTYIYVKLPDIPWIPYSTYELAPSMEFNIKVVQDKDFDYFSLYKVVILRSSIDSFKCNIDNTHNALKLSSINSIVVYYLDAEGKKHYYLKLYLAGLVSTQIAITLLDLSTDSSIPDDFSTNDMISITLPGAEVEATNDTLITNPLMNAALNSNTGDFHLIVLTDSPSTPPNITHPEIYERVTTNNWEKMTSTGLTGIYAWHCI
jgi:hypothetical protein